MTRPGLADRQQLLQWADTLAARSELPRLVRKLILETGRGVVQLGFPAGEGVSAGSWDGTVRAGEATAFVPAGLSLWELSVTKGVGTKADDDYAKRKTTPDGSPTADCTYVAAALRPWTKRAEWAKDRTKDKRWKEVRAMGLDDIETWLEDAPVTHAWLSEQLGLGPYGLRSADAWWHDWSTETNPELPSELVLAGRESAVEALAGQLDDASPARVTIKGGSLEEILAFVSATGVSASADGEDRLLARMAFVDDLATWRSLRGHKHSLVLVPVTPEVVAEGAASPVHDIVVPVPHAASADIEIPAIDPNKATEALSAAGLSDDRIADRSGRLARRSLLALRRHLAVKPELHVPSWATPPLSRATRGVLLAGRWADGSEGDQEVVAELVGKEGDELRELVEGFAAEEDPLVAPVGSSWALVAPFDAWLQMRSGIKEADLKRMEKAVKTVLLEVDPALDIPSEERWRASIDGKVRRYSGDLRQGLATSLTLLGVNGAEIDDGNGEAYASYLVRTILEEANKDAEGRIWASVSYLLPQLAEAAPDAFLNAVRAGSTGSDPVLTKMFQDTKDEASFLSSNSPHPSLLWALERVAWSPEHFGQAVDLLARLTEIDPGGQLGNRPDQTLVEIFCPWHPENSADDAARLAVVDSLRKQHPDVAWKLMVSMLPKVNRVHSPTNEPDFREWKPTFEGVSLASYFAFVEEVAKRLIEDAGDSAERWKTLVDTGSHLSPSGKQSIREGLAAAIKRDKFDPAAALSLWKSLRDFIARNREFADAQWALPENDLKELEVSEKALAPSDPTDLRSWLFADHMPDLGLDAGRREDFAKYSEELAGQRKKAVAEIDAEGGLDAVVELAQSAVNPVFPGQALADAVEGRYEDELLKLLAADDYKNSQFAAAYFAKRFRQEGWTWLDAVLDRDDVADDVRGRLLVLTDDYPTAWEVATERDAEVERSFWRQFVPLGLGPDFPHVAEVGRKLAEVGRPGTALQLTELYMRGEEKSDDADKDGAEIAEIMANALDELLKRQGDDTDPAQFSQYELQRVFTNLERHKRSLGDDRVARLEWAFLPALGYEPSVETLHRQLAASPDFFVQVVSAVYRAASSDESSQSSEQDAQVAQNGYRLLSSWKEVPGVDDGKLDAGRLKAWTTEALEKLDAADRRGAGEVHIGHVLAFSPSDPDGGWPCEGVRDLLQELQNENVEEGLRIQIFNNRGTTSRNPEDGGDQERALQEKYEKEAKAFSDRWPRTAAILRDLAKTYERQAKREDRDAERRRQGLDP